jgi:hypothetical protein
LYIVFYIQSSSLPVPSAIPVTLPFVVYAGTFGCTEFHRVSRFHLFVPFFREKILHQLRSKRLNVVVFRTRHTKIACAPRFGLGQSVGTVDRSQTGIGNDIRTGPHDKKQSFRGRSRGFLDPKLCLFKTSHVVDGVSDDDGVFVVEMLLRDWQQTWLARQGRHGQADGFSVADSFDLARFRSERLFVLGVEWQVFESTKQFGFASFSGTDDGDVEGPVRGAGGLV